MKFILTLALLELTLSYFFPEGKAKKPLTNFAFGSCYNGFLRQRMDIFNTLLEIKPDLFIFNGDTTYLDDLDYHLIFNIPPEFNQTRSQIRFDDTFHNEFYSKFRKETPIIGVWDDHDYGYNNADYSFIFKNITKQMFLDFLEYPNDHPKRKDNKGLYSSFSFGDSFKSFKIILLDTRYYLNDTEMLGDEQWTWLENELKSDETFTFLVSGVQVLPANRPFMLECWSLEGRKKLIDLLGKIKKSGVILLSGDIHFGETLRTPCIHPSKYILL